MAKTFLGQRDRGLRSVVGSQIRMFMQMYEATPDNPLLDYGLTQITDAFSKERPEPTIIEVPSRLRRSNWQKIGRVPQSISAGTVAFQTTANAAGVEDWTYIVERDLDAVAYLVVGEDTSPENPNQWVSKYVLYKSNPYSIAPLGENLNPKTGEDNAESLATGNIFYWDAYRVKTADFGRVGSSVITRSIVAADGVQYEKGNRYVALTTNAATSAPSAIVYGEDSGTYTQTDMTVLSTDGVANDVLIVGDYVLVLRSESSNEAHYYSTLDDVIAANDNFTEITTNYVATSGPVAGHAVSAANVILVGLGGYIYRLRGVNKAPTVIDAGAITTENLNDVAGYEEFLVVGGAANTVLVSTDGGDSFFSITGPSSGNAITAVEVVARNKFYAGTDNGELWYGEYDPKTGAATYTELQMDGATPTAVNDITFYTPVFGVVAANDGSAGLLFRTTDGGNTFSNATPEISRFSTALSGITVANTVVLNEQNEIWVGGTTSGGGIAGLGN